MMKRFGVDAVTRLGIGEKIVALSVGLVLLAAMITAVVSAYSSSVPVILVTVIGIVGVGFAVSVILARSIVRPLQQLTAVAEQVSTGDLDVTAEVDSDDELGELAAAFNRMVVSVRYYMKRHEPSIYEQIGGHDAVVAAVDEFYARVLADPSLARYFEGIPLQRLKGHQAAFLTQALRGPERYAGRSMREAHAGRGITDTAFDRVAQHLMDTLAHLGVGESLIQQIIAKVAPLRPEIVETKGKTSPAA